MISIDFYRPKYNIISTTKRKVFKIKLKCLRNNSSIFLANLTEWHSRKEKYTSPPNRIHKKLSKIPHKKHLSLPSGSQR